MRGEEAAGGCRWVVSLMLLLRTEASRVEISIRSGFGEGLREWFCD